MPTKRPTELRFSKLSLGKEPQLPTVGYETKCYLLCIVRDVWDTLYRVPLLHLVLRTVQRLLLVKSNKYGLW